MNSLLNRNYCSILVIAFVLLLFACNEEPMQTEGLETAGTKPRIVGHLKQTKTYSSDVVKQWLNVQTSMLFVQSGNPFGLNPARYMAYCGVALYESVVPGMPAHQSLYGQLTDMPEMPSTEAGATYHWPSAAHGALASMTKKFFSTTSAFNEQAVTNLENELNVALSAEAGEAVFERSVAFGQEVAERIFEWSKADNAGWPSAPYQLPAPFPGMWQPEVPGGPIGFPYWGYNRLMVPGSIDNTISPPPPAYSTDPESEYYAAYNEVYEISQSLTTEERLIAKYYNDVNPGYPAGAHYISILKQVFEQLNPALDKAAITYAKTGISLFDATTGSFKGKFIYLNERPFQYIRSVIAPTQDPADQWKPLIGTPPYPDFPSNHAVFSSSVAYALSTLYGSGTPLNNDTYEGVMADLGNGEVVNLGTRHYASFDAMTQEIALSRLYGGIHIRYACDEGRKQGKKTAMNVDAKLKFLK